MVVDLSIRVPQATEDYCPRPDMIVKTIDLDGFQKGSVVGFFTEGYDHSEFNIRIKDLKQILEHLSIMEGNNE